MLEENLKELGFSEKEARVFETLTTLGKASVQVLAKECSIPRTTVYSFIETLLEKGVIVKEVTRGSTYFAPSPPNSFKKLIDTEKDELQKKEQAAGELIKTLQNLSLSSVYNAPKVQHFEGRKKIEDMLYEYMGKWRESYRRLNHFTMWGYQDHTFVESYRRWHEHAWSTKDPRENICLFSNQPAVSQQAEDEIPNREIRLLPEGVEFASSIWIHGDYILMAMTRQEPHFAVVIVDAVLSANLRAIFQMLWASDAREASEA